MKVNLKPAPRRRLIKRIRNCGLSLKTLADKAQVSVSWLKNLLNESYWEGFEEAHLNRLTRQLGTSVEELTNSAKPSRKTALKIKDFPYLAAKLSEIDASIMPVVRNADASQSLIAKAYDDLLKLRASRAGLDLNEMRILLNSAIYWQEVFPTIGPIDLTIQISDDLEFITYRTNSAVIRMKHPYLLRNCLCIGYSEVNSRCPLHTASAADEILTRFDSGIIELQFMGLKILFRLEKSLWPPSIDSLGMVIALRRANVFQKNVRRLLDLGSGTGILGLLAMKLNPLINTVHLSDWMLAPALWGSLNGFLNRIGREYVEIKAILAMCDQGFEDSELPYDMCLCNPPYLPEHRSSDHLNMNSAAYGTSLLRFLISHHRRIARQTYVQFSNLAWPEAEEESKRAGTVLTPVGQPRKTPFKVRYRRLDERYIQFLKTRGLLEEASEPYPYWHFVQAYCLSATTQKHVP